MTIKNKIKPNEELYGDFELIPLNLDAVQQRIDFFARKVRDCIRGGDMGDRLNVFLEAYNFWEGIKREHCEVEI